MSLCSSCGASILWCLTANGKSIPVDSEPVAGGNLVLEHGAGIPRATVAGEPGLFDGPGVDVPRYVSHFATCPQAGEHRHRR